jgi:hypothetical protein
MATRELAVSSRLRRVRQQQRLKPVVQYKSLLVLALERPLAAVVRFR